MNHLPSSSSLSSSSSAAYLAPVPQRYSYHDEHTYHHQHEIAGASTPTDMLTWSRLPTPIPPSGSDLLSPPASGASSPKQSARSGTAAMPAASVGLSILTPSSSNASVYLSPSTSTYAITNALLPSPLPSPVEPSFASSSSSATAPPIPPSTSGSKTAAFFASPFAAPGPPTPAPPPKPLFMTSITPIAPATRTPATPTSSSMFPELRSERSLANLRLEEREREMEREKGKGKEVESVRDVPPQSATASFFATNPASSRPTPPPSLKSSSSREPSPPSASRLPPLARFFPSRYARGRDDNEDSHTHHHHQEQRLDEWDDARHDRSWDSEREREREWERRAKGRRADAEWETSFKREFLNLTEAAASSSVTAAPSSRSPVLERNGDAADAPPLPEKGYTKVRDVGLPVPSDIEDTHVTGGPASIEQIERPSVHAHLASSLSSSAPSVNPSNPRPLPAIPTIRPQDVPTHPHLHLHNLAHLYESQSHAPHQTHQSNQPHHPHHPHVHKLPIRRETHVLASEDAPGPLIPGAVLRSDSVERTDAGVSGSNEGGAGKERGKGVELELVRPLGEGAFSSVWLARDVLGSLSSPPELPANAVSLEPADNASSLGTPAKDEPPIPERMGRSPLSASTRRKSESQAKRGSDASRMHGIRPPPPPALVGAYGNVNGNVSARDLALDAGRESEFEEMRSAEGSVVLDELDGEGASVAALTSSGGVGLLAPKASGSVSPRPLPKLPVSGSASPENGVLDDEDSDLEVNLGHDETDETSGSGTANMEIRGGESKGRLVAVKLMNRALCDANDRTRISFVREVEVLRHISHPSIVSYLHSFSTSTHHALVLEHVGGGELFALVNSDIQYARVSENALRRVWGELARAVGWMHGVALVHRDIKLENILLTTNVFASPGSGPAPLPPVHTPLVKLTDFGLSRFIDPASPLLSTRCGSESYAAPELVNGASSLSASSSLNGHSNGRTGSRRREREGYYDGRQTDAWACGVVLYALATRQLPFDSPPPWHPASNAPSRAGSLRGKKANGATPANGESSSNAGYSSVPCTPVSAVSARNARRDMLMRIAQCEYWWPDEVEEWVRAPGSSSSSHEGGFGGQEEDLDDPVTEATRRLASPGLKRIVARLLVRDPTKRARLVELWDEPWMRAEGSPAPPLCAFGVDVESKSDNADSDSALTNGYQKRLGHSRGASDASAATGSEEGVLLDGEHIASVACQEFEPE